MRIKINKPVCILLSICLGSVPLLSCSLGPPWASLLTDDVQDSCRVQRADFNASQDYFISHSFERTGAGAMAGAVIGGVIGAVIGRGRGALTGAAAGAGIGGVAGYYAAMAELHHSREELSRSIIDDLDAENFHLRQTIERFRSVAQCRFRQADQIKRNFQIEHSSEAEASRDLQYVHHRFNEEVELAKAFEIVLSDREKEFIAAAGNLRADAIIDSFNSHNLDLAQRASTLASITIPSSNKSYSNLVQSAVVFASVAFDIGGRQIMPIDPWPPAGQLPTRPTPTRPGPIRQAPPSQLDRPT